MYAHAEEILAKKSRNVTDIQILWDKLRLARSKNWLTAVHALKLHCMMISQADALTSTSVYTQRLHLCVSYWFCLQQPTIGRQWQLSLVCLTGQPPETLRVTYTLFKPLVPKKRMLCILCAVASCCTLPLAILRLATKSGLMGGFMLFWLILKGSRPKLWLNSLRNCWQGVKRFGGWCVCVCAYVGFLLFLQSLSLYQKMCLSTHKDIYQINVKKKTIY